MDLHLMENYSLERDCIRKCQYELVIQQIQSNPHHTEPQLLLALGTY